MSEHKTIQIYVATHKQIPFDLPDYCSIMQVNTAKNAPWPNVLHDADGDNIASKNPYYSELTVLYSLWKNSNADIKGLMHYRRYLGESSALPLYHVDIFPTKSIAKNCISRKSIFSALSNHDLIVPIPEGPFPRNVFEDLLRFCYLKDICHMIDVIEDAYPEDAEALHTVLEASHVSYCNMFIARKAVFDDYCAWLFGILEKVEARCDLTGYDAQHARLYGYLSEVLMDVYILRHKCRCDYRQIIMPVDDTNASLRLRSELKRARNRFHDAFRLPPFNAYHRARYALNQQQLTARPDIATCSCVPEPDTASDSKIIHSFYSVEDVRAQTRIYLKTIGAKQIRNVPIGRSGRRLGVLGVFRESIFLYVILVRDDITNQKMMSALIPALEKKRAALETSAHIPTLVRLVIPETPTVTQLREFARKGFRLIGYHDLQVGQFS